MTKNVRRQWPFPSENHTLILYHILQLLWLYPIYSISFILNAIWYQDIADQAFAVGGQKQPKTTVDWPRFVNSLAGELYRVLLTLSFLLQHFLVSFIPYVGKYLSFIHMCWLYSLYSFEYKWALLNWSMEKRVEFFEDRGFYFVGFGMPFALLTVAFPAFINGGVFALAFPLFIILAMEAPVERCPPSLSVPIFSMPSRINVFFLRFLGNRCKWCKSKQQLSPFTNSAGEDDEKKLQ
jgi:etoposide-induced 2.4 mRNA